MVDNPPFFLISKTTANPSASHNNHKRYSDLIKLDRQTEVKMIFDYKISNKTP